MPTLRPLSFGEILDAAFVAYRRNFVVMYATGLTAALPFAAVGAAASVPAVRAALGWWGLALGGLLAIAAALVVWGALQQHASAAILEEPVTFERGYRAGLRAAPALCVLGVALGAAWVFFTFLSILGVGAGALAVGVLGVPGAVLSIFIWIGGIGAGQLAFFSVVFAAPAAAVLERRGAFAAIERGLDLSRAGIPRSMALIGVCALIMLLPMFGSAYLSGLLRVDDLAAATPARLIVQQTVSLLLGVLGLPFLAACMTLLYYDRRVRDEAYDVQLLTDRLVA